MLKKLGKYEIIEELGKGAMGIVYKAFDPMMARYVALKTMSYTNASDEEFKRRFYKEAQAPGRLHHENIVIIYELNEDQGIPFIAMEYLDGSDLNALMQSNFIFTLKKIIDIIVQVCEGLHYAHKHGIIHRDVKPANIFLLKNGKVKIVDFGIAQISQSSLLTKTGMILGTPSYMSPEQVKCAPLSGRSDQFSVGVILYELLTGRRPFDGDTYTTIMYKILHEDPIAVSEFYPTCPPELEAVVIKALSKNPEGRFLDLAGMARKLRKIESEMNQDVAMQTTMAISQGETVDKSLKIELIHRYMKEGKFDLALRVLSKLKELGEAPDILEALQEDIEEKKRLARIDELIGEGVNFFEDEHFDLALECLNEALEIDPDNPRVLEWVRKTHQKQAERKLRQTINKYIERGSAALGSAHFQEAIRFYSEALKLNPASEEIAKKLKEAQQLEKEYKKKKDCKRLCAEAKEAFEKGNRTRVKSLCQKALEILPDFADAKLLLEKIESEEKEEIIKKALAQIKILLGEKHLDQAIALCESTLKRTGSDPRIEGIIKGIKRSRRKKTIMLITVPIFIVIAFALAFLMEPPPPPPVPGFITINIHPVAEIVSITNIKDHSSIVLEDHETPLTVKVPEGEYMIGYHAPGDDKILNYGPVTVKSDQTVLVTKKLPGFNPEKAIEEILHGGNP